MKTLPIPPEALLLLGPTGSGKTPLGQCLESLGLNGRRCAHFDFGQELRNLAQASSLPSGFASQEQNFVRGMLESGALLEDRDFWLAEKIISAFIKRRGITAADLLVLNGLPRHLGQAQGMENLAAVTTLVVLECQAEEVFRRIALNAGGDRVSRTDDNRELIEKKLRAYAERTEPLVQFYTARGAQVRHCRISAESTAVELHAWLTGPHSAASVKSCVFSKTRDDPPKTFRYD